MGNNEIFKKYVIHLFIIHKKTVVVKKRFLLLVFLFINISIFAQVNLPRQVDRWTIEPDGSIEWNIDGRLPHSDHIEMSGKFISAVIHYGVNADQGFYISRDIAFYLKSFALFNSTSGKKMCKLNYSRFKRSRPGAVD